MKLLLKAPRLPVTVKGAAVCTALSTAAFLSTSCGEPSAWGEVSSLILIAPDALWQELEDTTYAVLEPTLFTTRNEKKFTLTQIDPGSDKVGEFRVFKQVLVFAPPDDPFLSDVAKAAGQSATLQVPSVFQATDVWARGQVVTAAVLDPQAPAESWVNQMPAVLAMVDSSFRERARNRMFVTGPDTAVTRELAERFGFSLVVPAVYRNVVRGDSIIILRNDNPDPSQLIRSVLVTWGEPPVDSFSATTAYRWRAAIDSVQYNVPQEIDTTRASRSRFLIEGQPTLEVTGVWRDEEGAVPAAGPFIDRLIQCPGRTYFLDAWLYAPDKSKYEYMLQLREILDSFRCDGGAAS